MAAPDYTLKEIMALEAQTHGGRPGPNYTFSLMASISQEALVSAQLVEGSIDHALFENFIYFTLKSGRG